MEAAKETAANIGASAVSGLEKTKAVVEEKVEKIRSSDPIEKDMATLRKEDRIRLAEIRKREAYAQNAAASAAATIAGSGGGATNIYAASGGHPEMDPGYTATSDVPNTKPVVAEHGHHTTVQSTMPTVRPIQPVSETVLPMGRAGVHDSIDGATTYR